MNKIITGLFLLLSYSGFSQASASASFQTSADVVDPIKINKVADLNFGSVIGGDNPGNIILSPAGTRTANGVEISESSPGEVNPAEATIGHGNNAYSITLPSSFSLFNSNDPSKAMIIDQFTYTQTSNGGNGTDIIKIGATLNLEANQSPGSYSNPSGFNATVSYN